MTFLCAGVCKLRSKRRDDVKLWCQKGPGYLWNSSDVSMCEPVSVALI